MRRRVLQLLVVVATLAALLGGGLDGAQATARSTATTHRAQAAARTTATAAWVRDELAVLESGKRRGTASGWRGSDGCFRCDAGPGVAAAALAAATGDRTALAQATRVLDALAAHARRDGTFGPTRAPETGPDIDTMFAAAQLGVAVQTLGNRLDRHRRQRYTTIVTRAADFLQRNGNLRWYTNGNIVLGNALVEALAWKLTGSTRYRTLYRTAWAFAVAPGPRWQGRGLRTPVRGHHADGRDGRGYFAEAGPGGLGYDPDYTMLQLDQLARLYVATRDRAVLRATNLVFNQLSRRLDRATMLLQTGGGSRHVQRDRRVYFDSAGLAVLAQMGGRSDLLPLVDRQLRVTQAEFRQLGPQFLDRNIHAFGVIAALQLTASRTAAHA